MNAERLYLDYNAAAPVLPVAREAVAAALALGGNASSVHGAGRAARRVIEEARESLGALTGGAPEQILFTSGGTEANVTALSGAPAASLIVSAIEHDSVRAPAAADRRPSFVCPVTPDGVADLAALDRLLDEAAAPALVSLMLANNETGVIQPVGEAAERVHAHGGLLHCDAIQAPGRLALDLPALGADLATLSGHKIGAPQGVGALWLREGLEITPLLRGGGQERRRRAGTENLPGIAGFGAAARAAIEALAHIDEIGRRRDRLEAGIRAIAPEACIFGAGAERLANTACVAMPSMAAETQVMAFDLEGICVSAGSACSSGKVQSSHVLAAMGVPAAEADCAIRVSIGPETAEADIDRFLRCWRMLYERAQQRRAASPAPA